MGLHGKSFIPLIMGFGCNVPAIMATRTEMEAKRTMVWIQPPGTPSVGHLLLDAYHATGDEYYYEAAKKVANTLIWGQLECASMMSLNRSIMRPLTTSPKPSW